MGRLFVLRTLFIGGVRKEGVPPFLHSRLKSQRRKNRCNRKEARTMKLQNLIILIMTEAILILLITSVFAGCKSKAKPPETDPFEYRFEKTSDREETRKNDRRSVTIRFDGVPFSQAMSILTQETGAPIVWGTALDMTTCYGTFNGYPLSSVLEVLARRSGASVADVGGVYYIGEIKKQDRAFAVVRIPPVDRTQLLDSLKTASSTEGSVSLVGSCILICDNIESLRKILTSVELIRERSERSYVAEVYFIRVNEESFVQLTADLQFQQIDIFSSSFNVDELFKMFVNADGGTGWSKISQRPVLYLSEGRKVTFSDGKEITREKKTVAESGAIETTGYSKFADGTQLTMLLNRVSDKSYAIDMDLSISVFDKSDSTSIVPAVDKSQLTAEGLLVQDSMVYYIGSLRRDSRTDRGGLFSVDFNKSHDMITIWLRVRELKGS